MGFGLNRGPQGVQEFPGAFQLDLATSPALSGTVTSLVVPNGEHYTTLVLQPVENVEIYGIPNGTNQKVLILVNPTEFIATLTAGAGAAGEAFASDAVIGPYQAILLIFNQTLMQWVILGGGISGSEGTFIDLYVTNLLSVQGKFQRSGTSNIVLAAGQNNNVEFQNPCSRLFISLGAGAASISGLSPSDGEPQIGDEYSITNTDAVETVPLLHGSGDSDFPFACPGGVDYGLIPGETRTIFWDAANSVFRV